MIDYNGFVSIQGGPIIAQRFNAVRIEVLDSLPPGRGTRLNGPSQIVSEGAKKRKVIL
jgi:hypothetical protein